MIAYFAMCHGSHNKHDWLVQSKLLHICTQVSMVRCANLSATAWQVVSNWVLDHLEGQVRMMALKGMVYSSTVMRKPSTV